MLTETAVQAVLSEEICEFEWEQGEVPGCHTGWRLLSEGVNFRINFAHWSHTATKVLRCMQRSRLRDHRCSRTTLGTLACPDR